MQTAGRTWGVYRVFHKRVQIWQKFGNNPLNHFRNQYQIIRLCVHFFPCPLPLPPLKTLARPSVVCIIGP